MSPYDDDPGAGAVVAILVLLAVVSLLALIGGWTVARWLGSL